jgi:uncharacterized protein (DUF1501 family)
MSISRRFFLQASGAVLATYSAMSLPKALAGPEGAPATQPAKTTRSKTLVVIFLRGGADGLNLVVPHGEAEYYKLRPDLAIARPKAGDENSAIDLDGKFGLNPRLKALKPWFDNHSAVAIQAVGYDRNTRSHFEEQDTWETASVGNHIGTDGWLNRHLVSSEGHGVVRALAIGNSLPRILRGKANAYAIRDINDLAVPGKPEQRDATFAALSSAYSGETMAGSTEMLRVAGRETLEGISVIQAVTKQAYKPAANYPGNNGLANKLRQAARLIKADIGLEIVQVDVDGWDTHQYQGTAKEGAHANLAQQLSDAMAAFAQDLGDRLNDCLVLTLSDFGRTAAENGTNGTDHGWGNALFAMGGPISKRGGGERVLGKWPGLAPEQLHEKRDLLHTTDFRDVIGEAVSGHLGNRNMAAVLPGYTVKPVGFFV